MTLVYVFQAFLTYLADCYRIYASSAIAANVIARSICGAACASSLLVFFSFPPVLVTGGRRR